ncbi:hypothetical protein D3C80_450050 [compost metagenome]
MGSNTVLYFEWLTPVLAEHDPGTRSNPQFLKVLPGLACDHVDVLPLNVSRQHISSVGSPTATVHRAKGQHARQDLLITQDIDGADTKTDRLRSPEGQHLQGAVLMDILDDHRYLIEMGHYTYGCLRIACKPGANNPHHVAGGIGVRVIAITAELSKANSPHLILLPPGATGIEEFGQQRVDLQSRASLIQAASDCPAHR